MVKRLVVIMLLSWMTANAIAQLGDVQSTLSSSQPTAGTSCASIGAQLQRNVYVVRDTGDWLWCNTSTGLWEQLAGAPGGGGGNVVGPSPGVSTDECIVRWDGTTGRIIQNATTCATLTDDGIMTVESTLKALGTIITGTNAILIGRDTDVDKCVVFDQGTGTDPRICWDDSEAAVELDFDSTLGNNQDPTFSDGSISTPQFVIDNGTDNLLCYIAGGDVACDASDADLDLELGVRSVYTGAADNNKVAGMVMSGMGNYFNPALNAPSAMIASNNTFGSFLEFHNGYDNFKDMRVASEGDLNSDGFPDFVPKYDTTFTMTGVDAKAFGAKSAITNWYFRNGSNGNADYPLTFVSRNACLSGQDCPGMQFVLDRRTGLGQKVRGWSFWEWNANTTATVAAELKANGNWIYKGAEGTTCGPNSNRPCYYLREGTGVPTDGWSLDGDLTIKSADINLDGTATLSWGPDVVADRPGSRQWRMSELGADCTGTCTTQARFGLNVAPAYTFHIYGQHNATAHMYFQTNDQAGTAQQVRWALKRYAGGSYRDTLPISLLMGQSLNTADTLDWGSLSVAMAQPTKQTFYAAQYPGMAGNTRNNDYCTGAGAPWPCCEAGATGTATDTDTDGIVMTDSGASFATNNFIGSLITNTTDGSSCRIASNTATTVTCNGTLSGGSDNQWEGGVDAYTVSQVGDCDNCSFSDTDYDGLDNECQVLIVDRTSNKWSYVGVQGVLQMGDNADSAVNSDCINYDASNDRLYYDPNCSPAGTAPGAGEPYLDQFGTTIDDTDMTNEDFGGFSCDGSEDGCTLEPEASFVIVDGAGSGQTADADADTLVIDADTNGGISILTPNIYSGDIYFGDPQYDASGIISYNHPTDEMDFWTRNAAATSTRKMRLSEGGAAATTRMYLGYGSDDDVEIHADRVGNDAVFKWDEDESSWVSALFAAGDTSLTASFVMVIGDRVKSNATCIAQHDGESRLFQDHDCDNVKDDADSDAWIDTGQVNDSTGFYRESWAVTDEITWRAFASAATVTRIVCEAYSAESTDDFTIKVCKGEDRGDDTCSTNLLDSTETTTLNCTTSGVSDTTINQGDLAAQGKLTVVVTAVDGGTDGIVDGEVFIEADYTDFD